MERQGQGGRGRGRSHRHQEKQPLIIELAQVLLDAYRVWESLVALAARLRSQEEQADEDSSGL